ncbi:hypothetical protein [Kribbella sp. DT2]|uniref:hypothetical protein n=1 Tax=Kribbella sp. DT2 TaxID=3393427 RepID=UPI003CE74265
MLIHDHLPAADLLVLDLLIVLASALFGLAAAQTAVRDGDPEQRPPPGHVPADDSDLSEAVLRPALPTLARN